VLVSTENTSNASFVTQLTITSELSEIFSIQEEQQHNFNIY